MKTVNFSLEGNWMAGVIIFAMALILGMSMVWFFIFRSSPERVFVEDPRRGEVQARLAAWEGAYVFGEFDAFGGNFGHSWVWELDISHEEGGTKAHLSVDGSQIAREMRAHVVRLFEDDRVALLFEEDLSGDGGRFEEGELLFLLRRVSDQEYAVEWAALDPVLPENREGAMFEKDILEEIDMADWRTYHNVQRNPGFIFEYPSEAVIEDRSDARVFLRYGEAPLEGLLLVENFSIRTALRTVERIILTETFLDHCLCHPSLDDFSLRRFGANSFYYIFHYKVHEQYGVSYYVVNEDKELVVRFQLRSPTELGVFWTDPGYSVDEEPEHSLLKQILSTFRFIDEEERSNIRDVERLVNRFYQEASNRDGVAAMDLFTDPETEEENSDFHWLHGTNVGAEGLRVFLRRNFVEPVIIEIAREGEDAYRVEVEDTFIITDARREERMQRNVMFDIIRENDDWKIDRLYLPERPQGKYSGLGHYPNTQ